MLATLACSKRAPTVAPSSDAGTEAPSALEQVGAGDIELTAVVRDSSARKRETSLTIVAGDYGPMRIVPGTLDPSELRLGSDGYRKVWLLGYYRGPLPPWPGTSSPAFVLDGWEPLDAPVRQTTVAEVKAHPEDFHLAHVEMEGESRAVDKHRTFDDDSVSLMLDGEIGLRPLCNGQLLSAFGSRLRVVGWLFTKESRHRLHRYYLVGEECTPLNK